MTDSQLRELEQAFTTSVSSTTIEWAVNFQISDLIQANPSLTPSLMRLLNWKLRKDKPVPTLLALSLLEIVAKNCGLAALSYVTEELVEALVLLVKKREGWKYSLGRNMFKTFGAGASSYSIDEGERELWLQASLKVREMLQLWADAFLLQEGRLQPIFSAYKRLRREGYTFPDKQKGASADICLMKGAEESPAFQAAGFEASPATSSSATHDRGHAANAGSSSPVHSPVIASSAATQEQVAALAAASEATEEEVVAALSAAAAASAEESHQSRSAPPAAPRINLTPAAVDATRDMCREIRELLRDPTADADRLAELQRKAAVAREEATKQIERQIQNQSGSSAAELHLESLMLLLDDLNEVLPQREEEPNRPSEATTTTVAAPAQAADLLGLEPGTTPGFDPLEPDGGSVDVAADAPLPPPPSEAPPDREQQERYDEILARYLQERENAAVANYDEDAALALRLSLEENGDVASPSVSHSSMASCSQCGAVNQLTAPASGGSSLFICYACGVTQSVAAPAAPMPSGYPSTAARHHSQEVRPTRHAPPARVITAGASELLIGGGSPAAPETPSTGGYVPPSIATALPIEAQSFEGGMGSQTLLGAPPKSSKAWKLSVPSVPSWASSSTGGSGYSNVKTLGDGAPASEYMSMDGEEGNSLVGTGPSASKSSMSSSLVRGLMPWNKKKKDDEQRESLLERVQVNEEWELIRPSGDQRPYWHNSVTQASQWQPPDVVTSNTGLLSG